MTRKNHILSLVLACAAIAFTGAGHCARAAEAEWAGGQEERPTWSYASLDMVNNIQSLLGTDAGADLIKQIPSLSILRDMDRDDASNYRIQVGAMGKHLPAGFNTCLAAILKSPKEHASELSALARAVAAAHEQAAPEVAFFLQSQAEEIAEKVVHGKIDESDELKEIDSPIFKRYELYGPLVSANPKIRAVEQIAEIAWKERAMGKARQMAMNLLRGTHFFVYDHGQKAIRSGPKPKYSRETVIAQGKQFLLPDEPPSRSTLSPKMIPPRPSASRVSKALWDNGYTSFETLPHDLGEFGKSNYLINGLIFYTYAPEAGSSIKHIAQRIAEMVKEGKTDIILDWTIQMPLEIFEMELQINPVTGLKKMAAVTWRTINKHYEIFPLWPPQKAPEIFRPPQS